MNLFFKYFVFTNKIRVFQKKVKFCFIVFKRVIIILCKKNRKLIEKELYFSNQNVFDKSVFTLTYFFENALFYEIKDIHKSLNPETIHLYSKNLPQKITLIIHGFRCKKVIQFSYETQEIIHSQKFSVKIVEPFTIQHSKMKLISVIPEIKIKQLNHTFKNSQHKILSKKIKIHQNPFIINDYL